MTCEFRGLDEVPEGERRSHAHARFESATVDGASCTVSSRANDIAARGVPAPADLIKAWRAEEGHRAAERATRTTGCPCRFLKALTTDTPTSTAPTGASGSAGDIAMETELEFEWMHVQTQAH